MATARFSTSWTTTTSRIAKGRAPVAARSQGCWKSTVILPGVEFKIEEGVNLSVGPFNFQKAGGFTLFHVLGVNQRN